MRRKKNGAPAFAAGDAEALLDARPPERSEGPFQRRNADRSRWRRKGSLVAALLGMTKKKNGAPACAAGEAEGVLHTVIPGVARDPSSAAMRIDRDGEERGPSSLRASE